MDTKIFNKILSTIDDKASFLSEVESMVGKKLGDKNLLNPAIIEYVKFVDLAMIYRHVMASDVLRCIYVLHMKYGQPEKYSPFKSRPIRWYNIKSLKIDTYTRNIYYSTYDEEPLYCIWNTPNTINKFVNRVFSKNKYNISSYNCENNFQIFELIYFIDAVSNDTYINRYEQEYVDNAARINALPINAKLEQSDDIISCSDNSLISDEFKESYEKIGIDASQIREFKESIASMIARDTADGSSFNSSSLDPGTRSSISSCSSSSTCSSSSSDSDSDSGSSSCSSSSTCSS